MSGLTKLLSIRKQPSGNDEKDLLEAQMQMPDKSLIERDLVRF